MTGPGIQRRSHPFCLGRQSSQEVLLCHSLNSRERAGGGGVWAQRRVSWGGRPEAVLYGTRLRTQQVRVASAGVWRGAWRRGGEESRADFGIWAAPKEAELHLAGKGASLKALEQRRVLCDLALLVTAD